MRRSRVITYAALVAAAMVVPTTSAGGATASDPERDYIVQVRDGVTTGDSVAGEQIKRDLTGPVFNGAVMSLTTAEAARVAENPDVVSVERDGRISGDVLTADDRRQSGDFVALSWGLDRTDQVYLPLNGQFNPPANGSGVHAYVIDSGIDLDNPEFAGRIGNGVDFVDGGPPEDCNQHGTHVSGTVGSTKFGMARSVIIHPVRVLDCFNSGLISWSIEGMNWVANNAPARSVVNMSFGAGFNTSMNSAARALVQRGLAVSVSAGNDSDPACGKSPASEPSVLTIGAVDQTDSDAYFSNYGSCVDLYAPGVDIISTDFMGGPSRTLSGTSMSSPHVTGAAAIYWSLHPNATGQAVMNAIMTKATTGILNFPFGQLGSPNKNLNIQWPVPASAPRSLTTQVGDRSAALSWLAPTNLGKPPRTGYRIERRTGAGAWTVVVANTGTTVTSRTITGLTNGQSYQFRVAAVNSAGAGPYVEGSTVTPRGIPGAAGKPTVKAKKKLKAKVKWSAAFANGAAVTYTLKTRRGSKPWKTVTSTTSTSWSGKVPKAKNKKKSKFRVHTSNIAGKGPVSGTTGKKMKK